VPVFACTIVTPYSFRLYHCHSVSVFACTIVTPCQSCPVPVSLHVSVRPTIVTPCSLRLYQCRSVSVFACTSHSMSASLYHCHSVTIFDCSSVTPFVLVCTTVTPYQSWSVPVSLPAVFCRSSRSTALAFLSRFLINRFSRFLCFPTSCLDSCPHTSLGPDTGYFDFVVISLSIS